MEPFLLCDPGADLIYIDQKTIHTIQAHNYLQQYMIDHIIKQNNMPLIKVILARYADHITINACLETAAYYGHKAMVQLFINNGATQITNAFKSACIGSQFSVATMLLKHGAYIDTTFIVLSNMGYKLLNYIIINNIPARLEYAMTTACNSKLNKIASLIFKHLPPESSLNVYFMSVCDTGNIELALLFAPKCQNLASCVGRAYMFKQYELAWLLFGLCDVSQYQTSDIVKHALHRGEIETLLRIQEMDQYTFMHFDILMGCVNGHLNTFLYCLHINTIDPATLQNIINECLLIACRRGLSYMINKLIQLGATNLTEGLLNACIYHRPVQLLKPLIQHGASHHDLSSRDTAILLDHNCNIQNKYTKYIKQERHDKVLKTTTTINNMFIHNYDINISNIIGSYISYYHDDSDDNHNELLWQE